MAFEDPGKPRYTKHESARDMTICIPSKKNWFIILFLGFWLVGWVIGEVTAIGVLGGGLFKIISGALPDATTSGAWAFGGLFMIAWLGGWTIGGAFAIYAWLWQVKGVEEIVISYEGLKINKKIPIWTSSKNYRLKDIVSLRVSNSCASIWNMSGGMEFWGITGGKLAFDYGAKTVRFGIGVDEAEAKRIIKDIEMRFPSITEKTR